MIPAEKWQPADGLTLEPNALKAARDTTRSLALTAGPGAGKTEMLAQRADFLLKTGTCRYPQRILAISFKVDACRNLKERVQKRSGYELANRLDSCTFHAFAKRLIDRFRPVLTGVDALDPSYTVGTTRFQRSQITFGDMVPLALQILQQSTVARNAVRQTYSHVFLDEFQDCTSQQYQLVRQAFRGTEIHLTAVGDTKQRIMGWAGALEGVFKTFAGDFGAVPLNLYQNFRSLPRLRRMQNEMVKVIDIAAAVPDTELAGTGGEVEVFEFDDSQAEAEALASLIQRRIEECEVSPSEIAVLVAKQSELYAALLMSELQKRNIPYRNEQKLQDLSKEPAARLIVDYLSVVLGVREPEAYERLMNVLLETGLDEDSAYGLRGEWYRYVNDTRAYLLSGKGRQIDGVAMRNAATEFLERVGPEALTGLSADYEQGKRLEEIIAETFQRLDELVSTTGDPLKALKGFSEDCAVRIMTIHKCKGLEFDTVAVLGVENETFWGKLPDERAVFFVAISRAKRLLWLSHTSERLRPEGFNGRWTERRTPQVEFLSYASEDTG